MTFTKLGQIYQVSNSNEHLLSHAANPLAQHLGGDVFRIYYNGRDADNRSSVAFVDIDIETLEVVNDPKEPIMLPGKPGSFYSHGISLGNLFDINGKTYIGFMGWQRPEGEHWRGDIGAFEISGENVGEPFVLIGTTESDPISTSYPYVYSCNPYEMWYGSTVSWSSENGEMVHELKHATSPTGLTNWSPSGRKLKYTIGRAQAFSRPCTHNIDGVEHMWFSYRSGDGTPYRIGHSVNDEIDSDLIIDVSESGWDSDMVCYPFVFTHNNSTYMLYNGNDYGRTGFGVAKLER